MKMHLMIKKLAPLLLCSSSLFMGGELAFGIIPPFMERAVADARVEREAAEATAAKQIDFSELERLERSLLSMETDAQDLQAACDAKNSTNPNPRMMAAVTSCLASFDVLKNAAKDLRVRADNFDPAAPAADETMSMFHADLFAKTAQFSMLMSTFIRTGRMCY